MPGDRKSSSQQPQPSSWQQPFPLSGSAGEQAAASPSIGSAGEHAAGWRAAWGPAVDPPMARTEAKPRRRGLTMVMDKGMSLAEGRGWLDLCAPYVDYVKLAFGTSVLYDARVLAEKIRLFRDHGVEVYPGGTLLEIAVMQDRVKAFVERARQLGFKTLEVSDGTINLRPRYRERLIRTLTAEGFQVLTEVGKKHPADRVPHMRIREQILEDLAAGAFKVIVEGRESGKGVVIYRDDGSIDGDELESLARAVSDPDLLIWEAPHKDQQQDLILRFGANVNLGNVRPDEVLSLEALRQGMRGDTLRHILLTRPELAGGPTWP